MNNCILMAEVLQDPQLRYTSDTQLEVTEMLVQFEGQREGEPPSTLKVVAWGNLAKEVEQHYRQGDRVVIEGRLSMNKITRQEGFKETRAELVAQKLYTWGSNAPALSHETAGSVSSPTPPPASRSTVPTPVGVGAVSSPTKASTAIDPSSSLGSGQSMSSLPPDYDESMEDDIPF
jgi:single-strand DNA-binding protein